jgi:hypothetical protein
LIIYSFPIKESLILNWIFSILSLLGLLILRRILSPFFKKSELLEIIIEYWEVGLVPQEVIKREIKKNILITFIWSNIIQI